MDLDDSFSGEYSGRGLSRLDSSEDKAVIRCDPCLSEARSVHADVFCEDCNQYLCETCLRFHKKFASTRNHVLVDKETMVATEQAEAYNLYHIDHQIGESSGTQTEETSAHHKHHTRYENTALAHIGDIDVKTSRDTKDCNITGSSLITADFIVIADNNNHAIKIVDTRHHAVVAEHKMSSAPWDVTHVEEGSFELEQLAVTLPQERVIQFLALSNGTLLEGRRLRVDGDCRGIAFSHNRLAVTCDSPEPCKVEILDMQGHIIKSLCKDSHGRPLFQLPQNIGASPDGSFLYITDRINCNVTKMTFDGNIVLTYDDRELCSPEGIAVAKDGTLIVCNNRNNMLHLVSPDCEKLKILKPMTDSVICPTAVCFCEQRNRIYVNQYWAGAHPLYANNIKIFEFELLPKK